MTGNKKPNCRANSNLDPRQGNFSRAQEAIWEREKRDGLIRAIVENPTWGRGFIKKMEMKRGRDYAQKLRMEANKKQIESIKGRQNRTQHEPIQASGYDQQS